MGSNTLEKRSNKSNYTLILQFLENVLSLLFFFRHSICFKRVNDIFQRDTFQEAAFTQLVCCINQILFLAYCKKNAVKSSYLRKLINIIHKMFTYLGVIISSIDIFYYIYIWIYEYENLAAYTPKESLMTLNEQIITFILIRFIPFCSNLFLFLASDQRVSKTTIFSTLVFFPIYRKRLDAYYEQYGEYPHPFLNHITAIDMNVICILLTALSLLLLIPLDKIKKAQLKYREDSIKGNRSTLGNFLYSIENLMVNFYNFINHILSALSSSIRNNFCIKWICSTTENQSIQN